MAAENSTLHHFKIYIYFFLKNHKITFFFPFCIFYQINAALMDSISIK